MHNKKNLSTIYLEFSSSSTFSAAPPSVHRPIVEPMSIKLVLMLQMSLFKINCFIIKLMTFVDDFFSMKILKYSDQYCSSVALKEGQHPTLGTTILV